MSLISNSFLGRRKSPVPETNPGFKVRINQTALKLLDLHAEESIKSNLKSFNLKSEKERSQDGTGGSIEYALDKIEIENAESVGCKVESKFSAGKGIEMNTIISNLRIKSFYKVKYKLFKNKGIITIKVENTNFNLQVGVGNEGFEPTLNSCDFSIEKLGVKFTGGPINWLINLFNSKIASQIKLELENSLSDIVKEQFDQAIVSLFSDSQKEIVLFDNFALDSSLVNFLEFGDTFLETSHSGVVKPLKRAKAKNYPFPAPAFTKIPTNEKAEKLNKMIELYLPEWLFDSIFYQMKEDSTLNFNHTQETIRKYSRTNLANDGDYLSVTKLFPNLAQTFTNSTFDIVMTPNEAPCSKIWTDGMEIKIVLNMTGYIRKSNLQSRMKLNKPSVQDLLTAKEADEKFSEVTAKTATVEKETTWKARKPSIQDSVKPIDTAELTQKVAGDENRCLACEATIDILLQLNFEVSKTSISPDLKLKTCQFSSFNSQFEELKRESMGFILDKVIPEVVTPEISKLMTGGIGVPKIGGFLTTDIAVTTIPQLLIISLNLQKQ